MKLKTNKITVLGTTYMLRADDDAHDPKLINNHAYVETLSKEIVYGPCSASLTTLKMLDAFEKKIIRHELIHAFFHESGLKDYQADEVLVDWIATQFPKLKKAFETLGVE